MSNEDVKEIFAFFDIDRDGLINYDEFLLAIRGPMSDIRRHIVNEAFTFLDYDNSNMVSINQIKDYFNPHKHPSIKSGQMTVDQVLLEFVDVLEGYYQIKGFRDGFVTREEFIELYSFISALVKDDKEFESMIVNTWCLNEKYSQKSQSRKSAQGESSRRSGAQKETPRTQDNFGLRRDGLESDNNRPSSKRQLDYNSERRSNVSRQDLNGERVQKSHQSERYSRQSDRNVQNSQASQRSRVEDRSVRSQQQVSQRSNTTLTKCTQILDCLREKFSKRGVKAFVCLRKQFKYMDDTHDGTLTYAQFAKSLRDYRIEIAEDDMQHLFKFFDKNANGRLDIADFMDAFIGELSDNKYALVKAVYDHLTRAVPNIKINDIKQLFSTRNHPQVRFNQKTEDEVLGEFIETFDIHHSLKPYKDYNVT